MTDFRGSWLKRRDSAKSTSFLGCKQKHSDISTILHKNTVHSVFPQCKTSIGNNSGSIKDRAVQFAYSRGFRQWQIEEITRFSTTRQVDRLGPNRIVPLVPHFNTGTFFFSLLNLALQNSSLVGSFN